MPFFAHWFAAHVPVFRLTVASLGAWLIPPLGYRSDNFWKRFQGLRILPPKRRMFQHISTFSKFKGPSPKQTHPKCKETTLWSGPLNFGTIPSQSLALKSFSSAALEGSGIPSPLKMEYGGGGLPNGIPFQIPFFRGGGVQGGGQRRCLLFCINSTFQMVYGCAGQQLQPIVTTKP